MRAPVPARHAAWIVLSCALAAAAAGCGGGGDGGSGGNGGDDNGAPTTPGTPSVPAGTDIGCGTANFQAEVLRLVNERRAAGASCGARGNFAAAPALAWSAALANAGYLHSKDMADKNYFSHDSQDGRSFSQRITAQGYSWSTAGENIAAGQGTLAAAVDGWMNSDGHCANIMGAAYRDIGLGCARNAGSQYGIYWTMDLAASR
jgi:uncharacterized protein YkwD